MSYIIVNNKGNRSIQPARAEGGGAAGNSPVFDWIPPFRINDEDDHHEISYHVVTDYLSAETFPTFWLTDVSLQGVGANGLLNRILPVPHPSRPGMYCTSCKLVDGKGAWVEGPGNLPIYTDSAGVTTGKAIFEVVFRMLPYVVSGDDGVHGDESTRFVERDPKTSVEATQLPGNSFQWANNGRAIPEGLAIQRAIQELQLTWKFIPDDLVRNLQSKVWPFVAGLINSNPFEGYAAGMALCIAPETSKIYHTASGTFCRDVKYKFLVRMDFGWNFYWRNFGFFRPGVGGGQFQLVVGRGGGPSPYRLIDFSNLFKSPA